MEEALLTYNPTVMVAGLSFGLGFLAGMCLMAWLMARCQGKKKPRGKVPAPTHVLTPEKKTSKKHKKD